MPVTKSPTERRDHKVIVNLTGEEYTVALDICRNRGCIPMSQYFRNLHLESVGRIGKEIHNEAS